MIKAYPRPSIEFCFNNSCHDSNSNDIPERIQIVTNHRNNDTVHTVSFTIISITAEDDGNMTLQVDKNLTSTVMLFVPCKYQYGYCMVGEFFWARLLIEEMAH